MTAAEIARVIREEITRYGYKPDHVIVERIVCGAAERIWAMIEGERADARSDASSTHEGVSSAAVQLTAGANPASPIPAAAGELPPEVVRRFGDPWNGNGVSWCGECWHPMDVVRAGKVQCEYCAAVGVAEELIAEARAARPGKGE